MDLLDRYLSTIRWNLPRGTNSTDILAELRDVIGNRIEEREDRLGRALTESELSDLLHDFDHPLVVAARYGPQQALIGPDLFPFYWFALKVVLAICLVVALVSQAVHVVADGEPLWALGDGLTGAFWSLLANAGLVTLIFAIIERTGWLSRYLATWKPEELPDLPDLKAKPPSLWESLFEVVMGIALILWWVGVIHVPAAWMQQQGLTLSPAPVWTALWAPILALMIARLVFNLIQWLRPRWKPVRAVLSVATAAGGLVLLALIYQAGHWVVAASTTMPAARVAEIERSTNHALHYAIIVIGVIWVLQCAKELWRLYAARR